MYEIRRIERSFPVWCRQVMEDDTWVVLDTETTGVRGEVIELSVMTSKGEILFDSLLKPSCKIESGAMAVHHITEAMVQDAPTLKDRWPAIRIALQDRRIITYNAGFDAARMSESAKVHGIDQSQDRFIYYCAMIAYAEWWNAPPRFGNVLPPWQKLDDALKQQRVKLSSNQSHRALGDVHRTLALINHIAFMGDMAPKYATTQARPTATATRRDTEELR